MIAKDWTGGDGGKLVIEIGFVKGPNGNVEPTYSVKTPVKMAFVAYREDDQVWMGKRIGKEVTGAFHRCVAGLNYLLRSGEIASDENVDIWC